MGTAAACPLPQRSPNPAGGCPVAQGWLEDPLRGSATAGGLGGQGKPRCLVACAVLPRSASSLKSTFQCEYCKRAQMCTRVCTPLGEGCQKRGAQALPAHKLTSARSEDRKRPGAALSCFCLLPLWLQRPAGYVS